MDGTENRTRGQKLSFLAPDKRLKTIFVPKLAKKGSFLVKNLIFFAFSQAVEDLPPILRVLDASKKVVGTHRSGKHNLQHPYAPKFPIFHEKNGKKWPLFGQQLSSSASDKQLKTPRPILRVLDAKKKGSRETQITKTQFTAYVFHEKTAKNGRFWSKIEFFWPQTSI